MTTTPVERQSEHFVRFYHDDGPLVADIACYLTNALESGCAIIIATARRIEAVRRELEAVAPEAADRLVALDAADTMAGFMVNGWPDRERFHAVVGTVVGAATQNHALVRAYGEMVALLCANGQYDAAVALEELWNELAQTCTFSLFCAYQWSLFPDGGQAESFREICGQHGHACPDLPAAQQHADVAQLPGHAGECIHSVGPDGTILWANKAVLNLLGYRWDEYVGQPMAQFYVDPGIPARLSRGEAILDLATGMRCKDGTIRQVLIRSNGCFADGRLRYTRCNTREAG